MPDAIPFDSIELPAQRPALAAPAPLERIIEDQFTRPLGPPDSPYAEVKLGEQLVAELSNAGSARLHGPARQLSGELSVDGIGPMLAERRTQQIAARLGGTVVKAPSALTQAEWNARPKAEWAVDTDALERARAALRRWVVAARA